MKVYAIRGLIHIGLLRSHGGGGLGYVRHETLGGEKGGRNARRVLQSGTGDLGRIDDARFHDVAVFVAQGVVAVIRGFRGKNGIDYHAAVHAAVLGYLTDRSLERFDGCEFAPAAFEAYSLAVASDLFARLPESVRDNGWFDVRLAYDNQDPLTGLAELGVTSGDLAPTLYQVEKNAATEGAPPYEVIAMRAETLANGYQYSEPELFADKPLLFVRM